MTMRRSLHSSPRTMTMMMTMTMTMTKTMTMAMAMAMTMTMMMTIPLRSCYLRTKGSYGPCSTATRCSHLAAPRCHNSSRTRAISTSPSSYGWIVAPSRCYLSAFGHTMRMLDFGLRRRQRRQSTGLTVASADARLRQNKPCYYSFVIWPGE